MACGRVGGWLVCGRRDGLRPGRRMAGGPVDGPVGGMACGRPTYLAGQCFRICRDATISFIEITLSNNDRRQLGIPVQKLCAWWSTRHRW
jgi:hypothetical protein